MQDTRPGTLGRLSLSFGDGLIEELENLLHPDGDIGLPQGDF
jgi:hypothetical protein